MAGARLPAARREPQRAAALVAAQGWPADEAGLRALPGIGSYTARALLCFCVGADTVPADVNVARVAARAWLGTETASAADVGKTVAAARQDLSMRDHVFALFDVGATLCRARQVECEACPLAPGCRSRTRLQAGVPPRPRRQAAYDGSHRQLRGAILREMLAADPPADLRALQRRVAPVAERHPDGAVAIALTELRREGLVGAFAPQR